MSESNQNKGGYGMLVVPLFLSIILLLFGWIIAKITRSYALTKIALLPAIFFIANLFFAMPFVCIGWVIALVLGNTDMAN